MAEYYAFLSSLTNAVSDPLRMLDDSIGIPIFTALILGLIGSTSPCQLTTNVTALAYVSRETTSGRRVMRSALAYLLGKVLVYSILGALIIVAGLKLSSAAVPAVVLVRKGLGPLLILLGLLLLGALRLYVYVDLDVNAWLEKRAKRGGPWSPFLLGVAFSLAFCPTLFWLFFGLLMPLSVASPGGLLYPGVFALGTTVPLLALAGLIVLGTRNVDRYVGQMRRADVWIRRAVGIIFIAGVINETIVYWLW